MASTYPGIIPYRSSTPSNVDRGRDSQVPQLLKVNQNFSLKRPGSMNRPGIRSSYAGHENQTGIRSSYAGNENQIEYCEEEDEILRDQYFQYWTRQQVRRKGFLLRE